ncbi:MAG: NAD-dependent malic enzyme [Actinobacteria bacterium]|nr:NAD-dependent malic enzyme [Actinomycetota bacterium]
MAVTPTPSASFSITLRVAIDNREGTLPRVTGAISESGGDITGVDVVDSYDGMTVREINVSARNQDHYKSIINALVKVPGAKLLETTDRTFDMHQRGKIEQHNKHPLKTRDDLSMAYTPGVARVCMAIHENVEKAYKYTIKANTVAVVSDGTAVLGLGDIGPEAAMPVMEGKAMLFKEFAGVDAFPICLNTKDPDEIVRTVELLAPTFGGINLEAISSPRCFEIERRLKESLDIPVFHDDQHGTAVVVIAALLNASKLIGKPISEMRVLVLGLGAAGIAVTEMLELAGVKDVIGCDRKGALHTEREDWETMGPVKQRYAEHTNKDKVGGGPNDAIEGCDLLIGLSGPGVIEAQSLAKMNDDAIVFAMANPTPEVMPEEAAPYVRIMATGRSDYPNQINNVLCFPGIFRGAMDARATAITDEMKMAAAEGIAACVPEGEISEDYIIPSVFNREVAKEVAKAVEIEAERSGVAKLEDDGATTIDLPAVG